MSCKFRGISSGKAPLAFCLKAAILSSTSPMCLERFSASCWRNDVASCACRSRLFKFWPRNRLVSSFATFWARMGDSLWYDTVNAIVAFVGFLVRLSTTSALITATSMSLVNRCTTSSAGFLRRRSA